MNSRERVNRCLEGRDHDRVPRYDHYWQETIQRWIDEGPITRNSDAQDRLGADMISIGAATAAPFEAAGQRTIEEDEQTKVVRDPWGQTLRLWKHKSGTPEHLGFDCDSVDKWRKVYKPVIEQADAFQPAPNADELVAGGKWTCVRVLESFEVTRKLMGDEVTLIAMIEDPEWVMDVSRTNTDAVLRGLDRYIEAGYTFDGLWVWGDMAYNHGTFCSPQMYRELIWPDHKRLADWAHAHDMKMIFHTDGDVRNVMDLYIEAGFDALQPLEAKANMDIRELIPKHGDRIAMFGNIDMTVAVTNDLDRLEAEVKAKLEAGKRAGNYLYHSDHSVPPQVEWKTYEHLIALLDQHGNY